uniref:Uncharacterized protein n=1 Tax=Parascaris equorum TaxID=6256 RepID=A0A914RTH9_PAREQ
MHFAPVVFLFSIIRLAENNKKKKEFARAFGLFKHDGIVSGLVPSHIYFFLFSSADTYAMLTFFDLYVEQFILSQNFALIMSLRPFKSNSQNLKAAFSGLRFINSRKAHRSEIEPHV